MSQIRKKIGGFNLLIMLMVLIVAGAMVVMAQQPAPGTTVYVRATENSRLGYNNGTTVGTAWSTYANSGNAPIDGGGPEILLTAAGDATPLVGYYSKTDTARLLNVFSTLATNAPNVANSIWMASNYIYAEGTANAYEMGITFEDATADVNFQFRDDAADTYHVIATPEGANPEVVGPFCPELLATSIAPEHIAEKLDHFVERRSDYVGKRYSEDVKRVFDWDAIIDEIEALAREAAQ